MPAKLVPRGIKAIIGMNSYDDPTTLQQGIVKLVQNMMPQKTSLDTRQGWGRYNVAVACTANEATDIFTSAGHGLVNDDRVYISATTLPTGISAIILYYIIAAAADTFQVSLTSGGAAVTFTTNGVAVTFSKALSSSAGIFGVAYYAPTTALDLELAISNGKLYSGAAGVFTERYTALSTNTLCQIVQFNDTVIISDQVNKMVAYRYGDTPYIVGINSPKDYKLIENFELYSDWSMVNGAATADKIHQIYGTQCVQFLSTVAGAMTATKTITAVNLTTHSDGSASSTSDYISLYLIRGVYANFTNCYLDLGDVGFAAYYYIRLDTLAEWTATSAPNVAFELKLRKSAFTAVGAPNWNNITAIRFRVQAAGGLQAQIICDFGRLEKTGPIPADAAVAGNLTGTYWYRVTYMTSDGWESDPSVISSLVTVTASQVNLTIIPVPGSARIASKKIYRLGGTSAEWRLLTILYDGSTTIFTDNIADANLGDLQDDVEGYPFIPKVICRHNKAMVIGNLTDLDGTQYPCGVMVSREESLDIYDALDFFEIEPSFGAAIKWMISTLDFVYVGKNDSVWKFDPQDLTLPPRVISRIYGGAGPLAVCAGENEFYWLDVGKAGVISYNGSFAEVISDSSMVRGTSVKNYIEAIPAAYIHTCWMAYYSQFVLVGVPQTGDTYPTLILAYYVPKRFWIVISGWSARCAYSAKIAGVNTLHLGHSTQGYVYNCFTGDDDAGVDITSIIQTADDDFDTPESRKDFAKLILWAKKLTSTDVTLTIEPYLDTVDSAKDITETIDSLTNKRSELGVPDLPYKGSFLGLKMTAIKRWSFRALAQWARLEPPPVG